MKQTDIPIWERYTLTIEEASKYFRIGENKLRRLADENKKASSRLTGGKHLRMKVLVTHLSYHAKVPISRFVRLYFLDMR